jgi:hypothetical protein
LGGWGATANVIQVNFAGAGVGGTTIDLSVEFEVFDGTKASRRNGEAAVTLDSSGVASLCWLNDGGGCWHRLVSIRVEGSPLATFAVSQIRLGGAYVALATVNPTWYAGAKLTSPETGTVEFILPKFKPQEIDNSRLPYEGSRATAVSVLFSNVTAVLNKEGTVSAARVATCDRAIWNGGYVDLINTTPPTERYFGPLAKGLYTFCLPDASSDLFLDRYAVLAGGTYPIANLGAWDYATLINMADLDSANPSTLAITAITHMEFRTTSALFPRDFSRFSLEAYHKAQMALNAMGAFYENPTHVATILRGALAALRFVASSPVVRGAVKSYATSLVTNAGAYLSKRAARAARRAANAGNSRPPVHPPAARDVVPAPKGRKVLKEKQQVPVSTDRGRSRTRSQK